MSIDLAAAAPVSGPTAESPDLSPSGSVQKHERLLSLDVLRGMKEVLGTGRPNLFIEVHGADTQSKEDNARQVVSLLLDAGYSVFHVESKQSITHANIETARQGHIYCEPQRD